MIEIVVRRLYAVFTVIKHCRQKKAQVSSNTKQAPTAQVSHTITDNRKYNVFSTTAHSSSFYYLRKKNNG